MVLPCGCAQTACGPMCEQQSVCVVNIHVCVSVAESLSTLVVPGCVMLCVYSMTDWISCV